MLQPVARKPAAAEAVLDVAVTYLLTVLDSAGDAGICLRAVVAPATGAGIPVSRICPAKSTVHSTGSDQRRADHRCFY